MPDAPRPPGIGGNVGRAWAQRAGNRRVFPPRPSPPPPSPPRRPPHGVADNGRRGEGGGGGGAAARGNAREEAGGWDERRGGSGVAEREVAVHASADLVMPDAPRPPGTGGNVSRAWTQRAGECRVFPPRPSPPPPPPPRRPPHGAADYGLRGEGGSSSGAAARGNARDDAGGWYARRGGSGVAEREVAVHASADLVMPDAPRPPGTGDDNVSRVWAQRAGERRVFPPPPPPPPRRPPHGAAENGRRGEGGGFGGAAARGNARDEAGGWYARRGGSGVADREVASADSTGAGRNAATVVAAGGEAPAPPSREESGGVGSKKRPPAPPEQHLTPPKRRAVFESRQFPPPASTRTAAAPAPLAGAHVDAGSRTRYDGERENRGSGALVKPSVARPLEVRKNGVGVLSRTVPHNAAPMANTDRHGPKSGTVKSSAEQDKGRVAGTDELWGKKDRLMTVTRLPPRPETISTTRTSQPGRGKDGGFSSKVHRPLESGRAHGGSAVPEVMLAIDDDSSLADGRAVKIGVAARTGTSVGAVQQDGKLGKGAAPSKESRGYQASSNAALLDSADVSARDPPGVSGNFGRKTPSRALAKDVKVMNKYGGSSYRYNTAAASFAKDSSKTTLMRNQNTVELTKVVQKPVLDTQRRPFSRDNKETVRGRRVTTNGIQDPVELTKDRVMQAPMSPDMSPMTHKKKAATTSDVFGHTRMVKSKAGHQQRKIASTSVSGSKGKLDDEVASNLKFHDIFRKTDFRGGKLKLYLNSSSGLPSVMRCQRQCRHWNADARSRFKTFCRMFEFVCRTLVQTMEQHSLNMRIDFLAAEVMKKTLPAGFIEHDPIVGQVPGVEVGDEFLYRSQLVIAGLHGHIRRGIDTTHRYGMLIAISIVASGGYPDELGCSGELVYTGSGGKPAGQKKDENQKLEGGNLALKNCMKTKTPVRVIHGFKCQNTERGSKLGAKLVSRYTYDGLYLVVDFWVEGQPGSRVFKYKLEKISGQPELPVHIAERLKSKKRRPGLCMNDISQGKEAIPISVINTIDDVRPAPFQYTTRIRYRFRPTEKHQGCDCTNGCSDSVSCACAMKNGGEIPFDLNGAILNEKSVIFECGPSCKCPPSCHNRVSQHDMKIPLEVFRTDKTGWGVRSLRSIPSGSFICEYIGELLHQMEADKRRSNTYLFDVGLNFDDEHVSGGLLSNVSGSNSSSFCSQTKEDGHFTIDASEYGNIGRFINHSCSPNLQAQNVLRDHDDKRMPHIMFFAAETIPPLQELTLDYNNKEIDRVRGVNRRMNPKVCQCGSSQCRRRFY